MKNVAVLTEDGAFALFFRPHPGGFDSSRVPTPGNLPSKAKTMLIPPGVRPGEEGWAHKYSSNYSASFTFIVKFCFLSQLFSRKITY